MSGPTRGRVTTGGCAEAAVGSDAVHRLNDLKEIPLEGLLERQAVLAELAGLARWAMRGAGRLVLLRGEAGVGKTAVIRGFTGGLGASARVMWGWCDPLAAPRPLGPLIDMLAALPPQEGAGLAAAMKAGNTEAVYAGLLGLFGSGGCWVWVIEDAHWADRATLDLLRFLARRVESLPLLLVVSHRDDEIGPGHPLAVALGDVATCASVARIGLDPLSRDAVAVLAAGTGVNAEQLYQVSAGNPFFVTEVLAAGPDALTRNALPRSVAEAVWGRLGRLSAPGRETTHAVAVCGPRASAVLVQKVCPAASVALDECLNAGVLVADGDVVGFRHELARRAALQQIPDRKRYQLHASALAALAEAPIVPDILAALVFHADEAGDGDAVLRYGPAAAERAAALGAHAEAANLYALALRHAQDIPQRQKVGWLEQHAFESYLCGLGAAAVASWREAIMWRRALGDPLGESQNLRWLSHALWALGRATEAIEAARASLRLVQDGGPSPQLAWSLANLAELSALGFDPACADYAAEAVALGTQLDQPAVVIRAGFCAALSTVLRTDNGWDNLDAVWCAAMATDGLAEHAGVTGVGLCTIAALHRHMNRADRYITDTLAYCRQHNLLMFESFVIGIEATVGLHRGDWNDAITCAEDVLTRQGLAPMHRIMPLITLALIRARRGQQPVTSLLDEALAAAEPGDLLRLGAVWAARAEAAWLAGDDDTARAEARAGLTASADISGDPWLVGHMRRWAHLAGEPADPAATADTIVTPYQLEIGGHWQAAAEEWTRRGCHYDAALAQLRGDIGAVESALATFRRLGARAAARRAQQRLAALRGRTPCSRRADTRSDPDGLTRREREVLELLAGGRSDAQIAGALHISPKTAGCHVSSILVKLGVENRIKAAAHALQRQTASTA